MTPDSTVADAAWQRAMQALDGADKVTGAAAFAFDLTVDGMLHAKVLRSPYPHAWIRAIDTTAADTLPGVFATVTGADLDELADRTYGVAIRDQPVIADGRVRFVGDSVAAVAAVDEETAYRALSLIRVDYEPLPPVTSIEAALADDAPALFDAPVPGVAPKLGYGLRSLKEPARNVLYEFGYESGDVEQAFAAADHVFEDTFHFSRINHVHLEPHVNIAHVRGDRIELWSCNQDPFVLRGDIARIFGVGLHRVRIHTPLVGGGFGGKSFCKMEPLVVLLAKKASRPVRLCLTMDESLLTLSKHAGILRLRTAVTADGLLLARDSDICLDGGAYSDASVITTVKCGYRVSGPYRWQAIRTRARAVRTNSVPAGSFRGFGGTQASFASDSQIDMIARRLGIDPLEFRRRNLLQVGEPFRPGDSAVDSDLVAGLDAVAKRVGYIRRKPGSGRGIGLGVGMKDGGGTGNHAQATVKVLPTGDVLVDSGAVEVGQGATTALAAIAARELDTALSRVRCCEVDTDHTPVNNGTHVSAMTTITGAAVAQAAVDAREQILAFAAMRLNCDAAELSFAEGMVRRGNRQFPLQELVAGYYGGAGREFIGRGTKKIEYDGQAPLNAPNHFWIPAWIAAEVEVDVETGLVRLLQLIVAGDAGQAVFPLGCRGQLEGAALQALGQALFEELAYDGPWPTNARPLAYRVPLARDLPDRFESIVLEQGMGPGPFGVKGIGEAGMLAVASAVANAIEDAVGVRLCEIPLTPLKVRRALQDSPAASREAHAHREVT